jgi:hypothetical protein
MYSPYPAPLFDSFEGHITLSSECGPSVSHLVSGDHRDISFVEVITQCLSGLLDFLDDVIASNHAVFVVVI